MTSLLFKPLRWCVTFVLALMLATVTHAQTPITFQYFYDEVGQLVKVVDSTGKVIEYVYDEVGNILEIKRSTVSGLAIIDFAPKQGPIGATVAIQGQGFSPTPDENTVTFNGVTATVAAATAATLVTTVPLAATTGPIAVTVGAETATSSQDFVVTTLPVITAISPTAATSGLNIPSFLVEGANFAGATFSFFPDFPLPTGIAIDAVSIDPTGTSATLSLMIGNEAQGTFVVIATNADGNSDPSPALSVVPSGSLDPTIDSDGDGFLNGLEIALGSNPFDPNSIPKPYAQITETHGPNSSILNMSSPAVPNLPSEAVGPTSSVENLATP